MEPKIITIKKTGKSHASKGKGCEDAFCISADNTVLCVADGVSKAEAGGVGASELTKQMCKILSHREAKDILENKSNETVRGFVHQNIVKIINRLSDELKKYPDAFASTFLALVRTSEKSLTVIHAGDGAVFAKPKNQQMQNGVMVLSYPDCYSGSIYAAAAPEQKDLMRVLRINPDDYNGIMLCTDGFADVFIDNGTRYLNGDDLNIIFYADSEEDFESYVESCHLNSRNNITDDITCVYYKLFENDPDMEEAYSADSGVNEEIFEKQPEEKSEKISDEKREIIQAEKANISDNINIAVKQADNVKKKKEKTKKDKKTGFKVSSADSGAPPIKAASKQSDLVIVAVVASVLAVILAFLSIFNASGKLDELKKQNEQLQEEISILQEDYKEMKDDVADINDEIYSLEQFHPEEQASEEIPSENNAG